MEEKSNRRIWKSLRNSRTSVFASLELSPNLTLHAPGLTLHIEPLVAEVWVRTCVYLDAKHEHLALDPKFLEGEQILKGTRIACQSVLGRIEGGETLEDLVEDYQGIS